MEYKYHPIYKYLVYLIISYTFLRHQNLMPNDKLLVNTILLTVFVIIVDHMFVHNHITLNQSLADQHIDNTDIKIMEKQLEDEIRKEDKMIEKMKKKKKKSKKQQIKEKKEAIREKSFEDEVANSYNEQQEIPYDPEEEYYQRKPRRLPDRDDKKHYQFYEPNLEQADIFTPTQNYNRYTPSNDVGFADDILAYNA